METDKSDPAFPTDSNNYFRGMTLRDWFAGMALQNFRKDADINQVAFWAYELADAMLKAKNNGNP